ncbi:helix-turn-helix domain-containing protein [Nitrospirillum iridis]|uniref:AraC-like DNA-binding protein n=1 Tax=Nitrospirillum iridis TaxID=765888 RepID=A0A7X0EE33_9PROT|nr:AraC family transcriptional regulator [Nitrospirillum iridis]MBB6251626.1 AraC-like DNA-binding protein [Nitrospirillum iridis]
MAPPFLAPKQSSSFTTGDLRFDEAKSFWRRKIQSLRPGLHIEFPIQTDFTASASFTPLGPAYLFSINVGIHSISRQKRFLGHEHIDDFFLLYVAKGAASISSERASTNITLNSGQWILVETAAGYLLRYDSITQAKILTLPRAWLTARTPFPEELALKPICDSNGWGRALSCVLAELSPEAVPHLPLAPGDIADQIAALLVLAAGQAPPPLRTGQKATMDRLRQAMRERLHDQTLTPTTFADQQGISKRTLHALFAAAGTSFSKELMAMRLEFARSLLGNPNFRNKSIAEISNLSGFTNPGHFGKRFVDAFGRPPSVYRHPHGGRARPHHPRPYPCGV